jgi:hypothetical protein
LIAASFGFIDEASKRWARVVFKLLALIVFGYCTLYSPSGRSFLTAVLGIFKTESHVLAVPTQATVNWEMNCPAASCGVSEEPKLFAM